METRWSCQSSLLRDCTGSSGCFFVFVILNLLIGGVNQVQADCSHYENANYLIDNWQGSDQLHENSAAAVVQTPDGYIWIGTYGGLVRFNGNEFTRLESLPGIQHLGETVNRLFVDRPGRLWVATESEIIVRDHGNWREVADLKKNDLTVRSFASGEQGKVWVGTLVGKLFAIENDQMKEVTPPTPLFPSGVFCCTDKKDGSLWLANRAYIGNFTEKGWQAVGPEISDRKPLLATAANDGGLWVYLQVRHELVHYRSDGSSEAFPAPAISEIRELVQDHDGMIWIGSTLSGLVRLKPGDTNFNLAITIANGLANNVVLAITEDVENNLWVGTGSGGLHKLVPRRFSNVGLEQGLPNPIIRTVIEESPGQMVVGTHGGGMARIQDGRVTSVHLATNAVSAASSYVWSALRDHNGRLWLGTFNGGVFYEEKGVERSLTNWPASLGLIICCLYEDVQNRIWVGSHHGLGLIENNRARPWTTDTNNPLAVANVRCIAEDKRTGALWIGTFDDGIFELQNDQLTHFGPAEGVPDWHVSALTVDAEGDVWAGIFAHGLVCIHDGKVIPLNRTNGLPADTIGSILEDGLGYCWLGSDRGVLRVSADGLRRFIRNPSAQIGFNVFDRNDGLASLQCAEGFQPTAIRDSSDRLWFATQKGVAGVNPANLHLNTNVPPVFIERVTYTDRDGKKFVLHNPGEMEMLLPAGLPDLKIDYTALSYAAPEKVRFDCQLIGPHQTWAEINQSRSQSFRILEPGRHRFIVRAANNDGTWNNQQTVFAFFVRPFVWQTVWFWAVVLGTVAAAIGFGGWRLARIQLRRQLEQLRLQRERVRLAAVMETTSDLVVFADEARNILHINQAGRRLLGLETTATLKKLSDLHPHNEYRRLENEAIPAAEKNGTWEGETTICSCAGMEIPVSAVIIVDKDANGKINFISAIARDISERKRAEEKQARLEEQLRQSQKMEAVGQLSGGVAHDFNNLLAVISGNVSLMELDETLLPDQREALNEIKLSSERATALTRQLLAFSRRQTMQPRNLNLNEVVENMTKMFRRILGEDIGMSLHLLPRPAVVHADAGMIEQVLLNLVVNARDAMPRGGKLEIAITSAELDAKAAAQIHAARPGAFAVLSVKDNGVGIAPDVLPRIFDPFFTTKDVGKGTGLGLATVYGIVQQHQGWVVVQSQLGKGATFQIYLPLLPENMLLETVTVEPQKMRGGNETVLLVEDEPALRKLVIRALTRLGYRIFEASTGVQALEVWKKNQAEIQLLLTDMVMPDGVGGIELAHRLQAQKPQLKVLYMSGYNAEIAGKETQLVEGVNFIPKPFDQSVLARAVRAALDA